MLHFFSGTDRESARAALNKAAEKAAGKNGEIVRVSDANAVADLRAALQGSGMFGGYRVVILEGILANEEMRAVFFENIATLKAVEEEYFVFESKPDADTRKKVEKYAEETQKFEAVKEKKGTDIFAIANALRKGDKKALWVSYQRALARDDAPEAIHGVLFWAAKQMLLSAKGAERAIAEKYVADLAELPHESRRKGFELEYALERYLLSLPAGQAGVNK